MHVTDPISYLFNSHEFYILNSSWDHVRAWLWCLSNAVVFVAYFLIPREILFWKFRLPLRSFKWFAFLFVSFIALCGISHIVMLVIMPTAPWWAILVSIALATISALTMRELQRSRVLIGDALEAIYQSYRWSHEGKRQQ